MKKAFCLSVIALMTLISFSAWAADIDDPNRVEQTLLANEPNPLAPGEYWLGIQFRPMFPALLAQLHLPEHQGLIVDAVVPDSPAAKVGLAQYDVILKADDKTISDISDLQQAVEAAKDKEMKLEIIREGQPKTIAITPAKRPEGTRLPAPPPDSDFEAFRKWIEQMQPGAGFGQGGPMRFRVFGRPGVILPSGAPIHPPLPGDMSIVISKTGDKPADISVKMGDEKWDVTEKDLDKLPDKVRPFVDRMLGSASGNGPGPMRWMPEVFIPQPMPHGPYTPGNPPGPPLPGGPQNVTPLPPGPPGPGGPAPGVPGPNPSYQPVPAPNMIGQPWNNFEQRIEKRFDEIRHRIDRLERELIKRHQETKTPEPSPPVEKDKESAPEKTM